MTTQSSIIVWEIPWTQKPCGLQSKRDHKESDTIEHKCMLQNMMMAKYNMSVGHRPVARHQFSNPAKKDSQKLTEVSRKRVQIHNPLTLILKF